MWILHNVLLLFLLHLHLHLHYAAVLCCAVLCCALLCCVCVRVVCMCVVCVCVHMRLCAIVCTCDFVMIYISYNKIDFDT